MTTNRKLVPQRLWKRLDFLALATVSAFPLSMQLITLCSAPWYINVLLISFMHEIASTYSTNSPIRITPSTTVKTVVDAIFLAQSWDSQNGSTINTPTASSTASRIIKKFSILSFFLSSCSRGTSSNRLDEYVSVFMPNTSESTNATTPRTIGRRRTTGRSSTPLHRSVFTLISPSGVRTATAYLPWLRIITPSMTACPPIPDDLIDHTPPSTFR